MPRLLRSWHSAIHNQAARRAAGDDFGRTTADGTGPVHVRRVRLGLAPRRRALGRLSRRAHDLGVERDGPGLPRRRSAGSRSSTTASAPRRSSAARSTASRTPRCSTSTGSRANPELEVIEFQQSALVYMGLDCEARRPATSASGARSRSRSTGRRSSTATSTGTAGRRTRRSRRTRSGTRRRSRRPAATTRARRRSSSTRPGSSRARTASGSSSRRSSSTTPTVRRVAETIREMLAAVGVRLELDGDPGLRRVLRTPQRAPAGVHLEVVLARAGRRDRRLHRDVGPGRRAELPALERRGARPRLPRLGARPRRRRAPRGRARHPAARRRVPAADPALRARGGLGAPPPRAQLAPEPPRSLSRSTATSGSPTATDRRRNRDVRAPGRSEAEDVVRPDLLRRHVARGDRRLPRQPRQRLALPPRACSRRTAGRS